MLLQYLFIVIFCETDVFFFQISDGTIEEDFEQALAREMVSDHRRGSGDHVNAGNVTIEGMYYVQKKITKENNILGVKKITFSVFFF